jgi:CubicO group peptidase (beta-lactamase class C family)
MKSNLYLQTLLILAAALPAIPAAARQPGSEQTSTVDARIMKAASEVRLLLETVGQIHGSFPATALVVATPDAVPLMYVQGLTRSVGGTPARANSPFYIGSQTKSFVGLLAARLDQKKELPLDTRLSDIWPGLQLPGKLRANDVTMRDLLSHQAPLKTSTLNFLTAYVRSIPAGEYPAMLKSYSEEREPGFSYSNLGYLIYAAALETRTGRPWKWWLQAEVLTPLRLEHTAPRSTHFKPRDIVWNHQWNGTGWIAYAPKRDDLMHAAGGLLSSPQDMARWIQANLSQGRGQPGAWKSSFAMAQTALTPARLSDGEFVCDGYGLGWYSCAYKDERVLMHPGQYVGTRSMTLLIPARQVGLSFMASSDSMIEGLALELMKGFIGLAAGKDGEEERLKSAAAQYPVRIASMNASRLKSLRSSYADAIWGGWTWKPTQAEEDILLGPFENERLGRIEILRDEIGLWGRLGAYTFRLQPAQPGVYAAWTTAVDPPEAFKYDRQADTVEWEESIFRRGSK